MHGQGDITTHKRKQKTFDFNGQETETLKMDHLTDNEQTKSFNNNDLAWNGQMFLFFEFGYEIARLLKN